MLVFISIKYFFPFSKGSYSVSMLIPWDAYSNLEGTFMIKVSAMRP